MTEVDEAAAIDEVISTIPARVRRLALQIEDPRSMNTRHNQEIDKLDKFVLEVLTELKRKIPTDPAEKFYRRLVGRVTAGDIDDAQGSLGVFSYRFMDSFDCMLAIKGTYRGEPRKSRYDQDYAAHELRLRGILKK
jgi:hypothetical protein